MIESDFSELESLYSRQETLTIVQSLLPQLQGDVVAAIHVLRLCRWHLKRKGLLHSPILRLEIIETLVDSGLAQDLAVQIDRALQPHLGHRESIDGLFLENLELAFIGASIIHDET